MKKRLVIYFLIAALAALLVSCTAAAPESGPETDKTSAENETAQAAAPTDTTEKGTGSAGTVGKTGEPATSGGFEIVPMSEDPEALALLPAVGYSMAQAKSDGCSIYVRYGKEDEKHTSECTVKAENVRRDFHSCIKEGTSGAYNVAVFSEDGLLIDYETYFTDGDVIGFYWYQSSEKYLVDKLKYGNSNWEPLTSREDGNWYVWKREFQYSAFGHMGDSEVLMITTDPDLTFSDFLKRSLSSGKDGITINLIATIV